MRVTYCAIALVTLATACADEETLEEPSARVDLRQALGEGAVEPVGVAVGEGGARFVFDRSRGLYQLTATGAVAIVPMSQMPDPGTPLRLPFTDLVAMSPGVFALTAIGDGFLLDTNEMTLRQHFCYEPGPLPDDLVQRTDAIAYDPELDKLYAQPLTFDEQGAFVQSQIASYNRASGADERWYAVGDHVAATAMTVVPDVGLVLGQGARLDRFEPTTGALIHSDDLGRFGVHSIDGLAVDAASGMLIVVDDSTDELVEIDLAQISW